MEEKMKEITENLTRKLFLIKKEKKTCIQLHHTTCIRQMTHTVK